MEEKHVVLGKMKYKADAKLHVDLVLYCFLKNLPHLLPSMSEACKMPWQTTEDHWTASSHGHMQVHCIVECGLQIAN